MLDMLSSRQKTLLRLLLKTKSGLTADELSKELGIAKNAVRQHIAALETDGLLMLGETRPSGGRPQQLYILTDKGKECFPRHYSWFAQMLIEAIQEDLGAIGIKEKLNKMGVRVANQLKANNPPATDHLSKVSQLTEAMEELGYSASSHASDGEMIIEAKNCVFHHLAIKNPEICQFDLALMSTFTDSGVDHQSCMAKGEATCCFKLKPNKKP